MVAAAAIDTEEGPSHADVRSETTDPKATADKYKSSASASQAAPTAVIGPAPGPAYISPELISGGNAAKSATYEPPQVMATALPALITTPGPNPARIAALDEAARFGAL